MLLAARGPRRDRAPERSSLAFAGYVASLTTVTRVGYPLHPRSMSDVHGIQVQGGSFPAEIRHGYMERALAGTPVDEFHGGGRRLEPYRGPRSTRNRP